MTIHMQDNDVIKCMRIHKLLTRLWQIRGDHFSRFPVIFLDACTTLVVPIMCSFQIVSLLDTLTSISASSWSKWEDDAEMDVRSDEEGYDPKWIHWRDNKSGASVQENYRKTTEVVRQSEENERGAHSEKNARCGHTGGKKNKRVAKPKIERCLYIREIWQRHGYKRTTQRTGQNGGSQLYRRPQLSGQARDEEGVTKNCTAYQNNV